MSKRKPTIIVVLGLCLSLLACEDDTGLQPPAEYITPPVVPRGDVTAIPGEAKTYRAEGAKSSSGHPLEYRFDFDASGSHIYSDWSSSNEASVTWNSPGTYVVKAQARCQQHPDKDSNWSVGKTVTIPVESVSVPTSPVGPTDVDLGNDPTYCTGAGSNYGHTLEYQFQHTGASGSLTTPWSLSNCYTFTDWTVPGDYYVLVRARCSIHTSIVSGWSVEKVATVQ